MGVMNIFRPLYSFMISFDQLGPLPELNYRNSPRYQSFLGTLMTFLTMVFSILTVRFTISSFFEKSNPDVLITTVYDENLLTFNSSNFKFYIQVMVLNEDFSFAPVNISELQSPDVFQVTQNSSGYFGTGIFNIIACDDVVFEDYNSGVLSSTKMTEEEILNLKSTSFCLDNNSTISLSNTVIAFDELQIAFDYESYLEVMQKYKSIAFRISYRQMILNPNNFTNYYSKIWKQEVYYPDPYFQSIYSLELENYNITKDETIFIFSETKDTNDVNAKSFSLSRNVIQSRRPGFDYMSVIAIGKSVFTTTTMLKYKSLNDIISELGGSYEILRMILELVVGIVINNLYSPSFINHVFRFHVNEQKFNKNLLENQYEKLPGNKISTNEMKNNKFSATPPPSNKFYNVELPAINKQINNDLNKSIQSKENNHNHVIEEILVNEAKNNQINYPNPDLEQPEIPSLDNSIVPESLVNNKLKEDLKKEILNKKQVMITPCDYMMSGFVCCRRKNTKDKIIRCCEEIIEKHSDISNIVKMGIDLENIKKILFDRLQRNFVGISSINLNDKQSLKYLKSFFKDDAIIDNSDQDHLIKIILDSDLNDEKNKKILQNFLRQSL